MQISVKDINIGDKVHYGDWDYGWESTWKITGFSPKHRYCYTQIRNNNKPIKSKELTSSIINGGHAGFDGFWVPIKLIKQTK